MTRRRVNNPLALAVLSCLTERPMHPYEISTTLRTRGKEASIKLNYGSLYSVVESLQKHGLVAVREVVREGRRPERTVYEITPAGQDEFEDWLAELLSTPQHDPTSLESALSLMPGLPPGEVVRLLGERAERLRTDLRSLDAMFSVSEERGLPELFLVESRYRRCLLSAELDFVTLLVRDIGAGTFTGTTAWRRLHELRDGGMSWDEVMADPVRHLGEEGRVLVTPQTD
ncbi:PadR family transcriptional regulator [Blastococcus sp. URHD0036]|uniref:PadR family transcriptional regulator n=1 Tax=Blastococcus sp. URHD0036 TaxID=1380356 RepID=UPI000497EBBB|nr:PadR family transcriptional regulator [Blastococcus sp. URHD0036]